MFKEIVIHISKYYPRDSSELLETGDSLPSVSEWYLHRLAARLFKGLWRECFLFLEEENAESVARDFPCTRNALGDLL